MSDFAELLKEYGEERELSSGDVLCRQGLESDGVFYLESGRLGAYREEPGASYFLSEILPGNLVGELGATTGWPRTATVRAEEEARVIHVSTADFRRAVREALRWQPPSSVRLESDFCVPIPRG
jgi:CRP-like cAMP-binding protein